ncbi:MAG: outer membrane lipoprotein chaperone LolA [Oligoflexia bacterium]|nr:outer membrane lipoprotein chaperone LolA [Oligoflexia bacterium]
MFLARIVILGALLAGPAGGVFAAVPAQTQVKLPALLQEVESKYAQAQTLTANFQETTTSAALKTTKKTSGALSFKRPGKVRWETLTPDKNLLVGDGTTFWYYTPPFDEGDNGQYSERPASKVQSRFAQTLLSASFSSSDATRTMKIQVNGPNLFTLIPKKGTAGTVKRATIVVDPKSKTITEVELLHTDGNRTRIVLSNLELGKPLDEKLFHFTPPPHTDKIEE